MDLSIIIPLKNEVESLQELQTWIHQVCHNRYEYEVIFIDDGSTDGSWSALEKMSAEKSNIRAIKFRRNYGKSAALHVGFQAARGRVVITMDADLQDSPDEIPALYNMIVEEQYDLVSGWKKRRHDPLEKRLPSKLFNATASTMSGIKLHDFNCGLKAYRQEVVKAIEVYGEMHRWIPVLAKWAGFTRIGEKVVEHRARQYGHSKYGWERYINGFLDLLSVYFVGRFGKRPMHFFGTLGVFSFFIGVVILAYLSWAKIAYKEYGIADRPLFYFGILALIVGSQLFLTGFLAEIVNRNSSSRNDYLVEKTI